MNYGQTENRQLDSLHQVLQNCKGVERFKVLKKLSELYVPVNVDTALYFAETMLKEAKKAGDLSFEGDALNLMGYAKRDMEMFEDALKLFEQALSIRNELGEINKASITLNLIGTVYHKKGDLAMSLEYYLDALEQAEIDNEPKYLSGPVSNIGKLYSDMGEYEKAKNHDVRALEIAREMGDKVEMAISYNNLGTIYQETNHVDTAKLFYKEALRLYEEINHLDGAANAYNNMAIIYFMEGDHEQALTYFRNAMQMRLKDKDMINYSQSLMNMGIFYQILGDYDSAVYYTDSSVSVAKEYKALIEQRDSYLVMAESYESMGDYKNSLQAFQNYVLIKDSILDENRMRNIQELQTKYKTEQQQKEIELKDLKIKQEAEEKEYAESRKAFQFMIIGIAGAALVLVLLVIVRGYLLKRKSNIQLGEINEQLESQKTIIEEKNKDITDSIMYAQRIQEAMLHSTTDMKSIFPESFILYKPKDIVAGDFYWWRVEGKRCYLAAADCTGHGVPGAMVSVVCSSVLNKSVKELGLSKPSDILDKATDLVIDSFSVHHSEENIKDGMDIALCAMDLSTLTTGEVKLEFAGANNPLWIIRKNRDFEEIEANRQPIGYYQYRKDFENNEIILYKGDSIYMFSDGFVDQFGGQKNKKFKSANFKKILLSIQDKSLAEQQSVLEQEFENWKGDFEQTDDVCVIGVRV